MYSHIVGIACGGAIGAVTRYLVSRHAHMMFGGFFPYGTLCVNILGALLIGVFFSLFDYLVVPRAVRDFCTVGFCGALTTFSTFSLETVSLLRQGEYGNGVINICLNVVLSLVCVIGGMKLFALFLYIVKQVKV